MSARKRILPLAGAIAIAAVAPGCTSSSRNAASLDEESGAALYKLNCASCHGVEGRGNGPVAKSMNVPVPDLTRIAAQRGGRFPREEIARIIDGLSPFAAHGTRQMPVWGYEFFDPRLEDQAAHALAAERVNRLVEHLASIQAPNPD